MSIGLQMNHIETPKKTQIIHLWKKKSFQHYTTLDHINVLKKFPLLNIELLSALFIFSLDTRKLICMEEQHYFIKGN
jgi:hypothetical protein